MGILMNRPEVIKPPRLHEGDIVGIVSPSWPIVGELRSQFDAGMKTLEELGLEVKLGKHALERHYYSAGTREARLEDFNAMWNDPEVSMILMSLGGSTASQLLDGIDYEAIRENSKIFCGISDGTTLLTAIHVRTGLVTYHGPDLVFTFGLPMSEPIKENIRKTFFSGEVGRLFPNPYWRHQESPEMIYDGWRCLRHGKASGILVGGHIRCLCTTIMAGFEPLFDDTILFLEGTDNVALTDRLITTLRLRGIFDKINGLILGFFEGANLEEHDLDRPIRDMVLEVTREHAFPILEIGELGHNVENYIFPIGCRATMDADRLYLSIDEKTVL
jgi:muramoyltetrapeptide carboxypeptidase